MVTVLLFIGGVLFVAVGIALSIALHEVGHLLPAKLFKVRVTRYMIGFGPTIWSRKKGETEYGVKAIPAGGYVAMVGMYPPNPTDGSVRPSSTGMFQTLATEARSAAHEEVGPEDANRVFYKLPVWKKIIIMLGGPFMNLLIGVMLMGVLLMGFGMAQPTTTVSSVNACQVAYGEPVPEDLTNCTKTPAAAAGLLPGDVITSFDGKAITDWNSFTEQVRASAGKAVPLVYERAGESVATTITPVLTARPVIGSNGQAEVDASGTAVTVQVGFLGVGPASAMVRQPASSVLPTVGENIVQIGGVVFQLPQKLVGVAQAAFSAEPRDPNGPISVVGVGRVAGEVAAMEQIPLSSRVATLISLMAGVNLALFVFNLIPLLPLDGGHVLGALYEGVRRSIAKVFKRKDPGPFDIAKMLPVTYVAAVVLIAMGALLIYADIVKPVNLFG
ncbi:site-2 protease family protein [Specibacter sp. NPDC078709]|uniref:M50 family metallopeptidase n=1 Tax=Specibacter sp. NPDC078709 TaxID=3154364 RepID=UPI0034211C27